MSFLLAAGMDCLDCFKSKTMKDRREARKGVFENSSRAMDEADADLASEELLSEDYYYIKEIVAEFRIICFHCKAKHPKIYDKSKEIGDTLLHELKESKREKREAKKIAMTDRGVEKRGNLFSVDFSKARANRK